MARWIGHVIKNNNVIQKVNFLSAIELDLVCLILPRFLDLDH
jgi:hypothetical protein